MSIAFGTVVALALARSQAKQNKDYLKFFYADFSKAVKVKFID